MRIVTVVDSRRLRFHRLARAILRFYPVRVGCAWLNNRLDRFVGSDEPLWMLAPGRGRWPTMELDVSVNLQRKFFYFPRLYGRFYGGGTFASYVQEKLGPGGRFLDIGANVGFFSLMASRLVGPTGRVFAFEPEPRTSECLRRSAQVNGFSHLEVFRLALSNRGGELSFHRAKDGTANSLVAEAPGREGRYDRTITTPVATLDALVAEGRLDVSGLSLVKVDVEGEEPRTIAGMLGGLVTAGHPSIWCEVRGPRGSTRAPGTYLPVKEQLASIGYKPFRWSKGSRRPLRDEEVVGRTDVLFENC